MVKVGGVMQNVATEEEQLDTLQEFARAAKVTPPTVISWLNQHIIEAEIAIGRVYRFNRSKCLAQLAEHSKSKGKGGR
jgi:hypothetical protein